MIFHYIRSVILKQIQEFSIRLLILFEQEYSLKINVK